MCFVLSGCFNGNKDETLKNGNYEVTQYSIDGVTQTEYIGDYATINGSTMTDWLGNLATFTIKGKSITITWEYQTMTLKGTVNNNVITINSVTNEQTFIVVLTYVAN